jgi:two-component sensor histidine kinase
VRSAPPWALAWLGWTALAVMLALQHYVNTQLQSDAPSPGSGPRVGGGPLAVQLRVALVNWYAWGLLAPLVVRAARRFSIWRLGLGRALAAHLPLAVLFMLAKAAAHVLLEVPLEFGWYGRPFPLLEHWRAVATTCITTSTTTYLVMVSLVHGFDAYRESRQRQLTASQLETRLAQAQLQLLQVQMQPHFLFNTLHAISALMHQDVDAADRMLARLSELLRLSMESVGTQEVSLRRELGFLQPYLDIEGKRFGQKLAVELDVAPDALDARVPSLLLQPLVENAIRHGVAPRVAPGRVWVRARRVGERLEVAVEDDGAGAPERPAPGRVRPGLGLSNTRARLEGLYGERHTFHAGNREGGGFCVRLSLPWRRALD